MRLLTPVLLLLLLGHFQSWAAAEVCTPSNGGCPKIESGLATRRDSITKLKKQIEDNYRDLNAFYNGSNPSSAYFVDSGLFATGAGKSLDTCGGVISSAWSPDCDRRMGGDTMGCECEGVRIVDHVVVKALNSKFDSNAKRNAGNLAAFAANSKMQKVYSAAASAQDYQNKWMYFGAADGSYALYPGRLWPRDKDTKKCGAKYDPRLRPWYLSAATGPKNVIFILDSSGSMFTDGRMALLKSAAKKIVDTLTFADYLGIVDFDDDARTMKNLNFIAPAASGFRDEVKIFIDKLKDEGSTNYKAAFKRAWQMADTSYGANYDSGCQTAYVFLTDGENTVDKDGFDSWFSGEVSKRQESAKRGETYFIIGLGEDILKKAETSATLKNMACAGKGVYTQVSDRASDSQEDMDVAEFQLAQALSKFSDYFTVANTLKKRELVTYSEIYGMSWDGVTKGMEVSTASVPVYDKNDTSRWSFLGVVAIDVTTCDLEQKISEIDPTVQVLPPLPEETMFSDCKCAESYTYKSEDGVKTFSRGECTTMDWPVAWCATENCGIKVGNTDTISTGYWADCKPLGARAVLEQHLKRSGEECANDPVDECELQALRDPGTCSSSTCTDAAKVANLRAKNFRSKLPGIDSIAETDWTGNAGDYDAAKWSADEAGCDQCKNEEMKPQCALPQKCGKSLKVPTRVDKYMDFGGATRHYASVKGSNVAVTLGLVLLAVVPALLH